MNASNTIISRRHGVTEKSDTGSFTVRYDDGPKTGLLVHFISKDDLLELVESNNMSLVHEIENMTASRPSRDSGTWSQWELTAKKNDYV